jgi:hypothetical protein
MLLVHRSYSDWGRAVVYWLGHYATNRRVVGSIPNGVIGIFQWHNGPRVDSASDRNEYQVYFLGVQPVHKVDNPTTVLCRHEMWEP